MKFREFINELRLTDEQIKRMGGLTESALETFLFEELEEVEATVITQYYGISRGNMTMRAIASRLKLTSSITRRLREKALGKLRQPSTIKKIARLAEEGRWSQKDADIQYLRRLVLVLAEDVASISKRLSALCDVVSVATRIPQIADALRERDVLGTKPIGELNLTIRSESALKADGIDTIGRLCDKTEEDLKKNPNLNSKSFAEIRDALASVGRGLRS